MLAIDLLQFLSLTAPTAHAASDGTLYRTEWAGLLNDLVERRWRELLPILQDGPTGTHYTRTAATHANRSGPRGWNQSANVGPARKWQAPHKRCNGAEALGRTVRA